MLHFSRKKDQPESMVKHNLARIWRLAGLLLFSCFFSGISAFSQSGSVNISLGANRQLSDQFSHYRTGVHFSPGLEYRFNRHFSLEGMLQFGSHNFDDRLSHYLESTPVSKNPPSLRVKNSEFAMGLTPKFYFSTLKGSWEYFVAPQLLHYRVKSDVSIHNLQETWYGYLDRKKVVGYYKSDNLWTMGVFAGLQRRNPGELGFSVQLGWQPINFGQTMNRIDENENFRHVHFKSSQVVARVCLRWNDGIRFIADLFSLVLEGLLQPDGPYE
jgi:hypothetical protein